MNSAHEAQEAHLSAMEPEKEKMSETSSEPSQSSTSETAPTAFGRNGIPQHCPWCGRRVRSRKMVRQITRAPEGAHTTPLGHPIATGDFLCVSSCYLAWLNSIGHFKYVHCFFLHTSCFETGD